MSAQSDSHGSVSEEEIGGTVARAGDRLRSAEADRRSITAALRLSRRHARETGSRRPAPRKRTARSARSQSSSPSPAPPALPTFRRQASQRALRQPASVSVVLSAPEPQQRCIHWRRPRERTVASSELLRNLRGLRTRPTARHGICGRLGCGGAEAVGYHVARRPLRSTLQGAVARLPCAQRPNNVVGDCASGTLLRDVLTGGVGRAAPCESRER